MPNINYKLLGKKTKYAALGSASLALTPAFGAVAYKSGRYAFELAAKGHELFPMIVAVGSLAAFASAVTTFVGGIKLFEYACHLKQKKGPTL